MGNPTRPRGQASGPELSMLNFTALGRDMPVRPSWWEGGETGRRPLQHPGEQRWRHEQTPQHLGTSPPSSPAKPDTGKANRQPPNKTEGKYVGVSIYSQLDCRVVMLQTRTASVWVSTQLTKCPFFMTVFVRAPSLS